MNQAKDSSLFEMFCRIAREFAPCMNDNLYVFDVENDIYFITENALSRFNIEKNVFRDVANAHRAFVHPDDYDMLQEDLRQMVGGEKDEHNLQYRWLSKNGEPIWINCQGRIVFDENGRRALMIGCINEIGKKQKADNVSGLLSESSLYEQLNQLSSQLENVMFLRVGIDDFRQVNERHGTEYGNYILRAVADRIKALLGRNQFVYRLVADEFMILDWNGSASADMKNLYHSIRSMIDDLVEEENYKAMYTISGGLVSMKDMAGTSFCCPTEAMTLSEFALAEAKIRGKNQMYHFRAEDYSAFLRKCYIRDCLREAVNHDMEGFSLNFQPIILSGKETLFAAETLLRFRTVSGENIVPYEAIPILEETGLIIPVGKWILANALQMCKKCREVYPDFEMSINFSYVQILKSPLYEDIMNTLDTVGLPPEALIVELTESGYLENSATVQNLWNKLRKAGVNIALDDFGTGYSNLINISNLRPNIVKVDRGFTIKALNNEYEHEIMQYLINMVHSIGLNFVVEGIETDDELQKINKLHPDYIQGYYYGRPCSEQDFSAKYLV